MADREQVNHDGNTRRRNLLHQTAFIYLLSIISIGKSQGDKISLSDVGFGQILVSALDIS